MFGKCVTRMRALILSMVVLVVSLNPVPGIAAGKKAVTVTPYAGQWKYYGQSRAFIRDEHYTMSGEIASGIGDWKLTIDGEDVGEHQFVVTGSAVSAGAVCLASPAPVFEVKEFHADDEVEEQDVQTVTGPAVITPPKGYLISGEKRHGHWHWLRELRTEPLPEGDNVITYYLRSDKNDGTRKAIDQTPRQVTVRVDATPPEITSLSGGNICTDVTAEGRIMGSEPGIYYYMVVPANYSTKVTREYIQENVTSKYGIIGFGRVDGNNAAPLHFQGMTAQTEYVIYAYMVDDAGNISPMVKSVPFTTDKMNLRGEVTINGTVEVDSTLTAKPSLSSVDTGDLTYQWYRIKMDEDTASFEEAYDETGGAEQDDLEADYSDDDEDEDDDEDDDYEEAAAFHVLKNVREADQPADQPTDQPAAQSTDQPAAQSTDQPAAQSTEKPKGDIPEIDGADAIEGADSPTYKVTREDIGYRLIACVVSKNYAGCVFGTTTTFVPKLMPDYKIPAVASAVYSPDRKLSSVKLEDRWSWMDASIVPVYKNSGYRAKYVPKDNHIYKTVVVRVPVPVSKKTLKRSMVKVKNNVPYTGRAIKDNITVKDGNKQLTYMKDYRVTWSHNVAVGKATFELKGIGNYKGKSNFSFHIKKRSVKNLKYLYDTEKVYTGKKQTARLIVKNGSVRLKKNQDYKIKYTKNIEIGRAKITVRGQGNYYGKRVVRFNIIPKKPTIRNTAQKKGGFHIQMKDKNKVSGFRVFVSQVSSFAKAKTQEYETAGGKFGVNGLTKGTYYVRIKAYRTV